MAICFSFLNFGVPNRRYSDVAWMSLMVSQLTCKWWATALMVIYRDRSRA